MQDKFLIVCTSVNNNKKKRGFGCHETSPWCEEKRRIGKSVSEKLALVQKFSQIFERVGWFVNQEMSDEKVEQFEYFFIIQVDLCLHLGSGHTL